MGITEGEGVTPNEQKLVEQESAEKAIETPQPGSLAEGERITGLLEDYLKKVQEIDVVTKEAPIPEDRETSTSAEHLYLEPEDDPEMRRLAQKLREIEGLSSPDQWKRMELQQRAEVMQKAHNEIVGVYGFRPCHIEVLALPPGARGQYQKGDGIEISSQLVGHDNPARVLETLIHESRHAYQYHAVKNPSSVSLHPHRVTEIQMWKENLDKYVTPIGYNWPRYRYQAIEVDAREFAAEAIRHIYGDKR